MYSASYSKTTAETMSYMQNTLANNDQKSSVNETPRWSTVLLLEAKSSSKSKESVVQLRPPSHSHKPLWLAYYSLRLASWPAGWPWLTAAYWLLGLSVKFKLHN